MGHHVRSILGVCVALILSTALARADDPLTWFNQAVQLDSSSDGKPQLAYALYRRAAEAGLPEAEFNVAVMLDSGRGVETNMAEAAVWYARAATHGNRRAAYNLGQLYATGEGVPKNEDVARAWFAASDLAAARARLAAPHPRAADDSTLTAPIPVAAGATPPSAGSGKPEVELVWTSQPQPEPVRFFVELRALDPSGSREIFASFADTTSILAPLPDNRGDYAWRVLSVAQKASRYAASDWFRFSAAPDAMRP